MKKSKLLIPTLFIASVGTLAIPIATMTSCNKKSTSNPIIGEKVEEATLKARYDSGLSQYKQEVKKYQKIYSTVSISGTMSYNQQTSSLSNPTIVYKTIQGLGDDPYAVVTSTHPKGTITDYVAGLPYEGGLKLIIQAAQELAGEEQKTEYRLSDSQGQIIVRDKNNNIYLNCIADLTNVHMAYRYVKEEIKVQSLSLSMAPCDLTFTYAA